MGLNQSVRGCELMLVKAEVTAVLGDTSCTRVHVCFVAFKERSLVENGELGGVPLGVQPVSR